MFDIGASELLVIAVVAILVIGPKDMPLALRTAGRWVGKMRRISSQFRAGFDAMVREAELEEMEKTWQKQNEEIMKRSAGMEHGAEPPALPPNSNGETGEASDPGESEALMVPLPQGSEPPTPTGSDTDDGETSEPELPLGKTARKG